MGTIIRPNKVAPPGERVIFPCGTFRGSEPWLEEVEISLGSRDIPGFVPINDFGSSVGLHQDFKTKYEWGDHHLRRALEEGGLVMFWFGKQIARIQSNRSYHFDRPYGAGADFELGRCLMWGESHSEVRLVVGCSPDYDRKKALLERVKVSRVSLEPIVGTIEDVLNETISILKSQ